MEVAEVTANLVHWSLDLAQAQAETASRNIANANVEGYRPTRVDFSEQLAAIQATLSSPEGLSQVLGSPETHSFRLVVEPTGSPLSDGVQLDREVSQMMAANTRYTTLVESLNRHFGLMRLAVSARG